MKCPSCHKEIPDGSTFCNFCGKSTQSRKASPGTKNIFGFLAASALFVCAIVLFITYRTDHEGGKEAYSGHAAASPALIPVNKNLVNGQLIVRAGSDVRYKLEIDTAKMLNPIVSGSFRASALQVTGNVAPGGSLAAQQLTRRVKM